MSKKIKTGVFIGRFQPVHIGHIHAISIASLQCEELIVLIGSSNQCSSIKNPWSYYERKRELDKRFWQEKLTNIRILPLNDYPYNDSQWIADVRSTLEFAGAENPVLFGHMKDGNDYLKWFPDFEFKDIQSIHNICSTDVRLEMFKNNSSQMPKNVKDDWEYYENEKKIFSVYPYPDTLNFNCADTIVECQGHILLIKRKFSPGKDTWALPGGFKNRNETFFDCAIRELFEETNIRVPEKVIRGSVVSTQLFDSPKRSFGIPRNTLAVYIRISPNSDGSLPRANGMDDAAETKWVSLNDALNEYQLYDDHKFIVSQMTRVMPLPAYIVLK